MGGRRGKNEKKKAKKRKKEDEEEEAGGRMAVERQGEVRAAGRSLLTRSRRSAGTDAHEEERV